MKHIYLCWEDNGEPWEDYQQNIVLVTDSYSKAKLYFEDNGWQKDDNSYHGLDFGIVESYRKEGYGWTNKVVCSGWIEIRDVE